VLDRDEAIDRELGVGTDVERGALGKTGGPIVCIGVISLLACTSTPMRHALGRAGGLPSGPVGAR